MTQEEFDYPGQEVFVHQKQLRSVEGVVAVLGWKNHVVVDQSGGGNFTDIQTAIDSITDASITNVYTVFIAGGTYTIDTITPKAWVNIQGLDWNVPRLIIGTSGAVAITAVDNVTWSNLRFALSSSGTGGLDTPASTSNLYFKNCFFSSFVTCTLESGVFENCTFSTAKLVISGASADSQPVFRSCRFQKTGNSTTIILSAANGMWGEFTGCDIVGGSAAISGNFVNLTAGTKVSFSGCNFRPDGIATLLLAGAFAGCNFRLDNDPSGAAAASMTMSGPLSMSGCTVEQTSGSPGEGMVNVSALASGPIILSGCTFHNQTAGDVFVIRVPLASDKHIFYISGCTLKAPSGKIIDEPTAGIASFPVIELSGNTYHGSQVDLVPASTGQISVRGTDVRSDFYPVSTLGTGSYTSLGRFPAMQLNLATETAFLAARLPAQMRNLALLNVELVMFGAEDRTDDTFTDTDGVRLNAHTGDTGDTWTEPVGSSTIQSNRAQAAAGSIILSSPGTDDHGYTEVAVIGGGGGVRARLFFRYSSTTNHWYVELTSAGGDSIRLVKVVSGVETTIATVANGVTYPGTIAVGFLDDDIRVFYNGEAVIHTVDSFNNTANSVGIGSDSDGTSLFDDFFHNRGGAADIDIDTDFGAAFESLDTHGENGNFPDVGMAHRIVRHLDISGTVTAIEGGDHLGVQVTLNSLTNLTAVYVVGMLLRWLPTEIDDNDHQFRPSV